MVWYLIMIDWIKKIIGKKPGFKKRVFVGVSGGVDSSVSAALLRDAGYDVTGVFIRTWTPEWLPCTWRDERRDAMRVCAHLEIPFVELDLEQAYKTGVADYMIAEYRLGRTPNPDVMCNKMVKFGGFLDWAIAQGADYIATGHYAQNKNNHLVKGFDNAKDQSYFLWTLTEKQLAHTLFPVGHLPKSRVRELAKHYNLPTAVKKDSQGICFIGEVDMKQFLEHYIQTKDGNVLSTDGKIIGHHNGALLYTLGERHGFVITDKGTHDKPYYVIAKDLAENTITVSQNPESESPQTILYKLGDTYFRNLDTNKKYTAQIRYHGDYKPCEIIHEGENYSIKFTETDYSIARGQSVVIYDDDVCIGGGIIA